MNEIKRSEIVDQNLQKIAKGTGIIFIGTIIGIFIGFASRILVVRYITQSEYGIYSLALVLMNISVVISTLGLSEGAVRQIAFYRGKNDTSKVKGVVLSSLQIALIASVIISLVVFLTSDFISIKFFHSPELSNPIKIFSIAIPFFVLINIFTSIFRGFDRAEPNVYFQNILRNVLLLLLLGIVILFSLSFVGIIYAYLASIVLTCIAFAIYAMKKLPISVKGEKSVDINPIRKELLFFSLPLFAVVVLQSITTWTDTLMLGYFKMPDVVGLYNAALPLANLLPVVLTSIAFLYVPIMSQLYAKDQMEEMKRSYMVLTKWIFSATLPISLVLFLFPGTVLNFLFGSQYVGAAAALQILTAGYFIHVIFGMSGYTLIVMGKNKFLMWTALISVILNAILNIALIPLLGVIGAAIATNLSLTLRNVFWVVKLFLLSKAHPFTMNFLKPIIASIIPIFIIYTLSMSLFVSLPFWMLPVLFILFVGMYSLLILLTRSFDNEDITMLLTMEKRLGVDLALIKKVLKRFI